MLWIPEVIPAQVVHPAVNPSIGTLLENFEKFFLAGPEETVEEKKDKKAKVPTSADLIACLSNGQLSTMMPRVTRPQYIAPQPDPTYPLFLQLGRLKKLLSGKLPPGMAGKSAPSLIRIPAVHS